jgi:integrase
MAGRITPRKHKARDGTVSWRATYELTPDPVTGKRRQKQVCAPTRGKVLDLVAEARTAINHGDYLDPTRATVREFLTDWLDAAEPTMRPSSFLRYRGAVTVQIIPALGSVPLATLGGVHLQRFYAGRLAAGLSPTTVALYHGILHKALDQAVKWRLLARNPCDDVTPPRPARPEMLTWTAEQTRTFLTETADDDLHALFRLALTLGLRQGELLALRWEDADLERSTLAVRRTLTRDRAGGAAFGEPKSAAGRRSIALPPSCLKALKRHQVRQKERRLRWGDAWHEAGLIFDRGDGRPLHHNVARNTFKRAAARLGLPAIRFHDQRHTAATIALADGENPKVIQQRLGHADISMTLNRYSHVTTAMQHAATERLEKLLGG